MTMKKKRKERKGKKEKVKSYKCGNTLNLRCRGGRFVNFIKHMPPLLSGISFIYLFAFGMVTFIITK